MANTLQTIKKASRIAPTPQDKGLISRIEITASDSGLIKVNSIPCKRPDEAVRIG